jgi:hypothetical protein
MHTHPLRSAAFYLFAALSLPGLHTGKALAQADQPAPRTDGNSKLAYQQMVENMKRGRIDVYFAGDSITRSWRATDYPKFLENWKENFFGWNAANFGCGGDTIRTSCGACKTASWTACTPR